MKDGGGNGQNFLAAKMFHTSMILKDQLVANREKSERSLKGRMSQNLMLTL